MSNEADGNIFDRGDKNLKHGSRVVCIRKREHGRARTVWLQKKKEKREKRDVHIFNAAASFLTYAGSTTEMQFALRPAPFKLLL